MRHSQNGTLVRKPRAASRNYKMGVLATRDVYFASDLGVTGDHCRPARGGTLLFKSGPIVTIQSVGWHIDAVTEHANALVSLQQIYKFIALEDPF
jgi:hypothetical protein